MEPWDGPASIAFTDGIRIGADARPQRPAPVALLRHQGRPGRHGLRGRRARHPARATSLQKGRLQPGRMFLVDTRAGPHHRRRGAQARDRRRSSPTASGSRRTWSDLDDLPEPAPVIAEPDHETVLQRQQAFGYTTEDLQHADRADGQRRRRGRSARWATTRRWPCSRTGRSCCTTTSSSSSPRSPTRRSTAIREEIIMSMETTIGSRGQPARADAASRPGRSSCKSPILTNEELEKLRAPRRHDGRTASSRSRCRSLFPRRARARPGWSRRSTSCAAQASAGDRRRLRHPHPVRPRPSTRERAPIPALLAIAARAPPPDPRGHAHAGRPGARDRRAARGASLRAAASATAPARSTRTWRSRRSTT